MKLTFAPHLHGAFSSLKSGLTQKSLSPLFSGGEGEIRTHGTREGSTVFETARFNRSRTSPLSLIYLIPQRLAKKTSPSDSQKREFSGFPHYCW